MPRYEYTAIESGTGREQRGLAEGDSEAAVVLELKSRGLHPTALSPSGDPTATSWHGGKTDRPRAWRGFRSGRTLTTRERMLFTRQLAALVRAGLPLLRSLEVLATRQGAGPIRPVAAGLAETIRSGGSLSDALRRYPGSYDRLYVGLVRAGEAAGALSDVLDRLALFLERSERTRRKVRAALAYPAFVTVVATAVVAALAVFVVPRFREVFAGVLKGQSLPALTEAVLAVADYLREHVVVLLVGGLLGWFAAAISVRATTVARLIDRFLLRLPVVATLESRASSGRFARTFGTLVGAGVPLLEALTITRESIRNRIMSGALIQIAERVRAGAQLSVAVEQAGRFPPVVASLIRVGEETGQLPEMLQRIADLCDDEVDQAVMALTGLLEPAMIVVMALVVGTVVIALFLPIIQIVQSLS